MTLAAFADDAVVADADDPEWPGAATAAVVTASEAIVTAAARAVVRRRELVSMGLGGPRSWRSAGASNDAPGVARVTHSQSALNHQNPSVRRLFGGAEPLLF